MTYLIIMGYRSKSALSTWCATRYLGLIGPGYPGLNE
jgi:hypothetical protein